MGKPKPAAVGAHDAATKRGRARAAVGAGASGAGAAVLPGTVTRIVREYAGGAGKRKNMFVPQALLDRARQALGVRTETEAVALGLAAAVDLAEFQRELLAGFDGLMTTGGLSPVDDEEVVLDGFRARSAR